MADNDSYYKSSEQILVVEHNVALRRWDARCYMYIFDFEFRTMTVIANYNNSARESAAVHMFPAIDPDLLGKMHDKLVELGGSPLPLGPIADRKGAFAAPASLRKPEGGAKP